ncbi:MAG TPA: phosphate ABC transporter permease subunit PstC, partial [Gaiellaceae bacterium]|nr:phosphate ABC transporter permease subunit PstC [Gaiellaceae bacterium]
ETFGLGFVAHVGWDPVHLRFGAGSFLFGTAVTSLGALLLAAPLALGIALFLSELAPRWLRGPVTALVETLAAVPSVVVGLWGILVLGPFLRDHIDPTLHAALGGIPLFGPATVGSNLFTAMVVLAIMILPIVASVSRELFLAVPPELEEGALALGATRWEMVRGVVLPYTRAGVAAALVLGLGRALGESIAVAQTVGAFTGLGWNLFAPGNTLAAMLALNYQGASSGLELSSLVYLALILLVISVFANLTAQLVVRRTARRHGGAA